MLGLTTLAYVRSIAIQGGTWCGTVPTREKSSKILSEWPNNSTQILLVRFIAMCGVLMTVGTGHWSQKEIRRVRGRLTLSAPRAARVLQVVLCASHRVHPAQLVLFHIRQGWPHFRGGKAGALHIALYISACQRRSVLLAVSCATPHALHASGVRGVRAFSAPVLNWLLFVAWHCVIRVVFLPAARSCVESWPAAYVAGALTNKIWRGPCLVADVERGGAEQKIGSCPGSPARGDGTLAAWLQWRGERHHFEPCVQQD